MQEKPSKNASSAVNWDWRGMGEKGGIDGFTETEGSVEERLKE